MPDEVVLRAQARAAIECGRSTPVRAEIVAVKVAMIRGELPLGVAIHPGYDNGDWQPCDGCGAPIRGTQIRVRMSVAGSRVFALYSICFHAWQVECRAQSLCQPDVPTRDAAPGR